MSRRDDLSQAKKNKNDEFYTQLVDIENEVKFYFDKFKNKSIFCNCDDPDLFSALKNKLSLKRFKNKDKRIEFYNNYKNKKILDGAASQFWVYFHKQFKFLKLKELTATHYREGRKSFAMRYTGSGDDNNIYDFYLIEFETSDGDFRSLECIELLKKSDIVVTNPPFSLFREYVQQLIEYQKQFLIIGNINATTYKEIFPLIKENKIWLGVSIHSGDRWFGVPGHYEFKAANNDKDELGRKKIKVKGVRWFTNLDYKQRHKDLILTEKYNVIKYPKYENYNAINIENTNYIPENYFDEMGVPITFLDKYSPNQFEIIGLGNGKGNFIPNKLEKLEKYNKNGEFEKHVILDSVLYIKFDCVKDIKKYQKERIKYLNENKNWVVVPYARMIIKRTE